ncbi:MULTISPECIES: hypothetical protein [unclassified Providencia]|uniref:hypothetical protein n=1 Tax=unclassified Providencia TaxID=2633465 RepID=UPI00234A0241|nr:MULTISPECIES: hypothetical protein [unclassified Providencia]
MNSYWLIGIYLLIIGGIFGIARCFKTFKIDAKPLTQQTLFWLAIIIPIASFIYFGLFAWWGKTPVFSAHGFERFIKISTLPLGLLSLAIPFTAVINNIHRTVQTNEQIEQAQDKNKNDLYFSHRKNIIDIFNSLTKEKIDFKFNDRSIINISYTDILDEDGYIAHSRRTTSQILKNLYIDLSIQNPVRLYYKFYDGTNDYNYQYNNIFFSTIKDSLKSIDLILKENRYEKDQKFKAIEATIDLNKLKAAEDILFLESVLDGLFKLLSLPDINKNHYISLPIFLTLDKEKYKDIELTLPKDRKISELTAENGIYLGFELISHFIDYRYLKEIIKQSYYITLNILTLVDDSLSYNMLYPSIEDFISDENVDYFTPIYFSGELALYCDERFQIKAEIRHIIDDEFREFSMSR